MSTRNLLSIVALGSMLAFLGCGGAAESTTPAAEASAEGHAHGGWWCDEHGVPEEVCGLCSTKVAAEFKARGNWCDEHDRPDSQCFLCHPEKETEYAALYEAKYGKQPPHPAGT